VSAGVGVGTGTGAACNADIPNENRLEDGIGGRTGGFSALDKDKAKGTSGGVVDGTGFAEGSGREKSRDALRKVGRRGVTVNGPRGVWNGGEDAGMRLDDDMVDFVTVDVFLRMLAERMDCDSAKSSDRKDRRATESRCGWRVK